MSLIETPTPEKTTPKNQINVMTFNVELFLNLYQFTMTGNSVQSVALLHERVEAFRALFDGIDVACLQETYISGSDADMDRITNPTRVAKRWCLFDSQIHNLCRVHSGKSHILDWATATYLYGTPSYLANSVYVSERLSVLPIATADTEYSHTNTSCKINNTGLDRGYSLASVLVDGTPVKIVSVHLIGGRYDDVEALQNESYRNEKTAQIAHIIQLQADIICGDFNTKIKTAHIAESTNTYFEHIYTCSRSASAFCHSDIGDNSIDKAEYKAIWDKWIYMDSIHALLSESGYKSVYYDEAELRTDITDTCMFGGIVDMIYYNQSRVRLVENSVQSMHPSVMVKRESPDTPMFCPILSDHFPVKASFVLV